MNGPPLVSVITIFLDAQRFITEAVDSVLAQTYPHWELLLCDDGSSDGSTAIARAYAAAHPARIRYLEHADHANRGMSATRNLGISHARGTLLAFLDADDVWEPEKLEQQVAVLERHPEVAITFGPSLMWHGWTGDADDASRDEYRRVGARADRVVRGTTVLRWILAGRAESPGTCSWLVRTDAARAVGGFETDFRGMFEDQAFFAKLMLGHDAYIMRASYDRYRQHADSSCNIAIRAGEHHAELPAAARDRYLQWLGRYLEKKHANALLRARVARERWFYRHPALARFRKVVYESTGRVIGRAVGIGFDIGRVLLPRGLRQRLWRVWSARRHPVRPAGASRLTPAGRVESGGER